MFEHYDWTTLKIEVLKTVALYPLFRKVFYVELAIEH